MRARFTFYAWSVLAFHLVVILWGAFVRASGSGAGCGQHWPLCNGQIVPQIVQRSPLNATLVEFGHRCTSGIALVSVLVLFIWAFRVFPRGYGVRGGALLALVSTVIECAIGAALVLLRLVGSNESLSRGLWLGAHLVNTLFLLAALSVTSWQATRGVQYQYLPRASQVLALSIFGFLCAAILGGFAALGDTLSASTSLIESMRADFSASSNIFVRLRIFHPIAAAALGIWLLALTFQVWASRQAGAVAKRLSGIIAALVLSQAALGLGDITLRTPAWLQLMHLFGADLLWIACVLLASETQAACATGE
jgi:cytochrome c oxidase assembly protein subunit 15